MDVRVSFFDYLSRENNNDLLVVCPTLIRAL